MIPLAGTEEYKAAANKHRNDRSPAEQALVDDAKKNGMTDINNIAAASESDRRYNW